MLRNTRMVMMSTLANGSSIFRRGTVRRPKKTESN